MPAGERELNRLLLQLVRSAAGGRPCRLSVLSLFGRLKDRSEAEGSETVPATLILYRREPSRVICSILKVGCTSAKTLAVGDLFVEGPEDAVQKFREIGYRTAILGKGDFAEPIRKVFRQRFGFTVL